MERNANSRGVQPRRRTLFLAVLAISSCGACSAQTAGDAPNANVSGIVTNVAGEPVSGALIKIASEGPGPGFMVVSQEQGRYSTPAMVRGKYTIQAFGGGYQSASAATLEVAGGQQTKMDLALKLPVQFPAAVKRLTDADFEKLMPESDVAGVKHSLAHQCNECHTLERIVSARKTPEKWRATIDRMRDYEIEDRHPLWIRFQEDGLLNRLWHEYLAKYLGPTAPQYPEVVQQWLLQGGTPAHTNRNWPATLLRGAAAKYVAMEYSLPPGTGPRDIAVDSKGIAWVGERDAAMLGRFDPKSLSYTRIALPQGKNPQARVNAVAVDPKDQVWFVDDGQNGRILQYHPESGMFDSYAIPEFRWPISDGGWARIATLRFLDGMVWGAAETSDRVLKLNPANGKVTDYSVPRGSAPFGLAVGPNKTVWYAGLIGNSIVRVEPKTGRLEPHNVPTDRSELKALAADSKLNLWAAATESGKLVRVDNETGDVVEIAPPTENSGPFALDVDTTRDLVWFSEVFSDRIARFDPAKNDFVEFPHPSADSDVRRIEVDRSRPNRVWWVGARGDKFGYIEVME